MSNLRIPKKHRDGFFAYFKLSNEIYDRLMSRVRAIPYTLDLRGALISCFEKGDGLSDDEVESVAEALHSLSLYCATTEAEPAQFVKDFVEAVQQDTEFEAIIKEVALPVISERITELINAEPLAVGSKASSINLEYDKIFHRGRVLTDVRPVFGARTHELKAALIVHSLRIHFHVGEHHKDVTFAMDTNDLQKLIDVLDRAKRKAESLRNSYVNAGIAFIKDDED